MNNLLDEGWAAIARLQNTLSTSTTESTSRAIDLMIDCQLDRIAAGCQAEQADPAELRRAVATANRRERYRARLTNLYLVAPAIEAQALSITQDHEAHLQARDAVAKILNQAATRDAALLLRFALGDDASTTGLSATATRKRLSRLRSRFSHLKLDAA